MRRALTLLVSCSLVCVVVGCGQRYDRRMQATLEKLKYNKRLDSNLMPPPADGKLKETSIYLRAPKPMERAKQFQLTALQPGQFDVEETFFEGNKSFLHVLARQKAAKKAAPKKGEAPAEPVVRGDFSTEVRSILGTYFNDAEAFDLSKFKDDVKGPNRYKRATFKGNGKNVEVYMYKADNYDVALIFVIDPAEQKALDSKITLALESFSAGGKAKAKYEGAGSDEEAAEAAGVSAF